MLPKEKSRLPLSLMLLQQAWEYISLLLALTPKPLNIIRVLALRLFGGTVGNNVFLHPRCRIDRPWNVTLEDGVTLGDRTHLYALDKIHVKHSTCIAQEAYICTGTHDFTQPHWPLVTKPITIGSECFIGLRAVLLDSICDKVILGTNSLVTKPITNPGTYVGQPVRCLT